MCFLKALCTSTAPMLAAWWNIVNIYNLPDIYRYRSLEYTEPPACVSLAGQNPPKHIFMRAKIGLRCEPSLKSIVVVQIVLTTQFSWANEALNDTFNLCLMSQETSKLQKNQKICFFAEARVCSEVDARLMLVELQSPWRCGERKKCFCLNRKYIYQYNIFPGPQE